MKITEQCVVALTWALKDTLGEELDTLDEPVEFLVGGSDLLASLERALQGYEAGDTLELQIEPQDAFGDYDDRLLFLEPRHLFPENIEEGMGFEGLPEGCSASAPRAPGSCSDHGSVIRANSTASRSAHRRPGRRPCRCSRTGFRRRCSARVHRPARAKDRGAQGSSAPGWPRPAAAP